MAAKIKGALEARRTMVAAASEVSDDRLAKRRGKDFALVLLAVYIPMTGTWC
jgi:hypothetical protein